MKALKAISITLFLLFVYVPVLAQDKGDIECKVNKEKSTKEVITLTCLEPVKGTFKAFTLEKPISQWSTNWPRWDMRNFHYMQRHSDGSIHAIYTPPNMCDKEMNGGFGNPPANSCRGIYQDEWDRRAPDSMK